MRYRSEPAILYFGTPVVLISTVDEDGSANLAPMSSLFWLGWRAVLGRIERNLFILDWLQNVDLRRRVQVGLNKGEARNALARAVFFHWLGEIRDRDFEQQRYRTSDLNLLTAAIVLWNTVHLRHAVQALRAHGRPVDEALLPYLSPLG